MNNKGFTLIELLVVIVILGLISFLGFPVLIRTLTNNSKKEFEIYGESMVGGAKLYIQKEGYDLIKDTSSMKKLREGNYTISLEELVNEGYINEFKSSRRGHKCIMKKEDDPDVPVSYVKVKLEETTNTYTYSYHLVCNDGKKDITLPE